MREPCVTAVCHTPQGSGMSRINHLQRRDGRYWANIRFDAFRNSGEHRKHIRFSLRTSDLRVAQYRLASIMPRIIEFRIDPDRRRSAIRLQNWMLDFMNRDPALPATEQDLLSSEALRQMVYTYISKARDAAHPTLGHAPNFFHIWRDYLQTYDRMREPTPA